jgi:hypothetical protein
MNRNIFVAALLAGPLVGGHALADCAEGSLVQIKKTYESAQAYERAGNQEAALFAYRASEGDACEGANPYEADAAKHAAALGQPIGAAYEKKGDFHKAFQAYDAGGHFAAADRALMELTRSKLDEPNAFETAREHFDTRALPAFQSNNKAALKVTGPYQPDPKLVVEVAALPAKAVEHTLQKEAAAFNEQYLRDYVQVIQSRPDDPTDADAIQRAVAAQQAFAQKYQDADPIKASQQALYLLRQWGSVAPDAAVQKTALAQFAQRTLGHGDVLAQKYSAAPKLLEDATTYYNMQEIDDAKKGAQIAGVKSQALKLADAASAKQRFSLASEYYEVAGDHAKSKAADEQARKLAMAKAQPSIDAMQKQAEAIRQQYSDPKKVQEMKDQAEAMKKALQQQQAGAKQNNQKSAAELEKELGL